VLRHERGLDPLRDLGDALDMRGVESLGAAERQADAVQRDRIIAADGRFGANFERLQARKKFNFLFIGPW
jgi:hypothetical protein